MRIDGEKQIGGVAVVGLLEPGMNIVAERQIAPKRKIHFDGV